MGKKKKKSQLLLYQAALPFSVYGTSLDDRLEENKPKSLQFSHKRTNRKPTEVCGFAVAWHQQTQWKPELCAYSMLPGCSLALREGVTRQHSWFPGCSRRQGGTDLVSFPQPIFFHPPHFPIWFVFPALWINNFKHFSCAHQTCSSVHSDFSEAVHCCLQDYFPLSGPSVCNLILNYWHLWDNGKKHGLWY